MSSAGGSMTSADMAQPTFDPSMAPFVLMLGDGTNMTFPAVALDSEHIYDVQSTINKGSQLGASLLLLVLLPVLTKAGKRASPIFVLNCLSLFFNFMRLLLDCLYYTGPFRGAYVLISNDYSSVPFSAYQLSIIALSFSIPLIITAEISLALQVQVVLIDLRRLYRRILLFVSCCVALCAISFRIAGTIINAQQILALEPSDSKFWILGANINATAASIFYFSAVFVTKLGLSLYQRHKLGLRRWGPMKILFTMGFQTLLIPAIFAMLQYSDLDIPDMDSDLLTAVAIFLPLSSIWAAASIKDDSGRNNAILPLNNRLGDESTLQGSNSRASLFSRKYQRSSTLADTSTIDATLESAPDFNWANSPVQPHLNMNQAKPQELSV